MTCCSHITPSGPSSSTTGGRLSSRTDQMERGESVLLLGNCKVMWGGALQVAIGDPAGWLPALFLSRLGESFPISIFIMRFALSQKFRALVPPKRKNTSKKSVRHRNCWPNDPGWSEPNRRGQMLVILFGRRSQLWARKEGDEERNRKMDRERRYG